MKGWQEDIMNNNKKMFSFSDLSKYRTLLMGVQIILIIIFHFTADCKTADVHYSGLIAVFYNYIRSSGVDIFLALSGIGLYFSWKNNPSQNDFYRKRLTRIFIPYLLVAIPSWLFLDIIVNDGDWLKFFGDVSFITFFSNGTRTFWYILMSFICYLIFPHVFRIVDTAQDTVTEKMRILLLCVTSTVVVIALQLYYKELYSNVAIALTRFPAFFVGVLLGKATYEKRETPVKNIFIWTILSVLLIVPLGIINKKIIGTYTIAFFNLCFCFLLIVFLNLLSCSKNRVMKFIYTTCRAILEWFGKYTIELYLTHVIIRKCLKALGLHTYRYSVYAAIVVSSIIISIVLNRISNAINKKINKKNKKVC